MNKIVIAAALLGSAAVAFAKGPQKAGNWHITVSMEMPGMGQMPPRSFDKCVTPEQSDDPKKAIKQQAEDCDPADVKISGNTVTYKIVCHKRGGTQTGTGEMTYAGDSYSGTMTLEMNNPRGGGMVKMVEHMSGQRTGDCAK
jgi:hypothetical protein